MSWTNLQPLLERSPALRDAALRIVKSLQSLPSSPGIDPLVLGKRAGVDELHTLAALGALLQAGLGSFVVQVVNERGQAVGEYPSLADTPPVVPDDYGGEVAVEPANTRIVFRPQLT